MNGLFQKMWISLIFNLIFICCYHIHTVRGVVYSCVSMESVPTKEFKREKIENIAYVKYAVIEVARVLHVTLQLDAPLPACDTLAKIETTYWTWSGWVEYKLEEKVVEAMMKKGEVLAAAMQIFEYFNENTALQLMINREENISQQIQIYKSVDLAIQRLTNNLFAPFCDFIDSIRSLKFKYSRGYQLRGLAINTVIQTEVPATSDVLFAYYEIVKTNTDVFMNSEKLDNDEQIVGLLYVGTNEVAVVKPDDSNVLILGSDDASLSIIVILKHSETGVCGLTQLDDNDNILGGITYLVNKVIQLSDGAPGMLEAHLIGSYFDSKYTGETILFKILEAIHEQQQPINLITACVGKINTEWADDSKNSSAKISGAAVMLQSGIIVPASFSDKGPELPLRTARIIAGYKNVVNVYDNEKGHLLVGPFHYKVWSSIGTELAKKKYDVNQELINGPHYGALPINFITRTRDALKFLKKNPDPWKLFPNNEPHRYGRDPETFYWTDAAKALARRKSKGKGKGIAIGQ